jgi:hypothetical protein
MPNNSAEPDFTEPSWMQRYRKDGQTAIGVLPRVLAASMFLHRDLNDDALRSPVERMFSTAELTAMRQQGFDAGHAAGVAELAASKAAHREASEVQALQMISTALADAGVAAAAVADAAASALAKTLVAAMNAVMPDLIRRSGLSEAEAMLALVLPGVSREPTVRIEVAREAVSYVSTAIASLEYHDKISVIGLDEATAGEVRVRWDAGHASRQPTQVWQAVMRALQPALDGLEAKDHDNGE